MGVWNAENPRAEELPTTSASASDQAWADDKRLEQIGSTLAQAGCPGWMVLAEEGEAALQPPASELVPGEVQQTAHRVPTSVPTSVPTTVPSVRYPVPLRVASRTRIASSATPDAFVSVGAKDDPDDLLDGVPDLLVKPEQGAEESQPPPKEPQAPAETPAADENLQLQAPQQQPETPAPETPAPETPAPKPPAPETPAQEPQQVPTPQTPKKPMPGPARGPSFAPPAAPQVQQAEPVDKPQPLPTVPQQLPAQPVPQQSPFAPPPGAQQAAPHSLECRWQRFLEISWRNQDLLRVCRRDELPLGAYMCQVSRKNLRRMECLEPCLCHGLTHVPQVRTEDQRPLARHGGYFCYRCHSPVGTTLGISRAAPLWELPQVAREGVTCIACHRVNQRYGKVNGDRRIEPETTSRPFTVRSVVAVLRK